MDRELVFNGYLYIPMLENETEEQADSRLYRTLEDIGVCIGDYECQEREY